MAFVRKLVCDFCEAFEKKGGGALCLSFFFCCKNNGALKGQVVCDRCAACCLARVIFYITLHYMRTPKYIDR